MMVTLKWLVRAGLVVAATALPMVAQGQFASSSYSASKSFGATPLVGTTMTLAHSSTTGYWASSGCCGGLDLANYDNDGNLLATYSNTFDFRSLMADATGTIYARMYADHRIYRMDAPNMFTTYIGLELPIYEQSSVTFNSAGTEFIALFDGAVHRWNLAGQSLGFTTLVGFGDDDCEDSYPQNRGVVAAGGYYFTVDGGCGGNERVFAWSESTGQRTGDALLLSSGNNQYNTNFSLSYADGLLWLVDDNGGTWRGYDFGVGSEGIPGALPPQVRDPNLPPEVTPEPASIALVATGLAGFALAIRRRRQN